MRVLGVGRARVARVGCGQFLTIRTWQTLSHCAAMSSGSRCMIMSIKQYRQQQLLHSYWKGSKFYGEDARCERSTT